jgi:Arc/MetJ-type ribon-helix-helix transcriptional regulator
MASAIIKNTMSETDQELSAIVRAGCFASEAEALREAVQTMLWPLTRIDPRLLTRSDPLKRC